MAGSSRKGRQSTPIQAGDAAGQAGYNACSGFVYSVNLACAVGEKLFLERLPAMPNAQKVAADREAAMPAFMAMNAAKK